MHKPTEMSELPKYLKPELDEPEPEHINEGVFEFEFSREELIEIEGNTVYHTIPHYAEEGAESVLDKLRRIIAVNLEETE